MEFKKNAVKQVEMEKSIGLIAKEVGLVEQTLRNWWHRQRPANLPLQVPRLLHRSKRIYPGYMLRT
ncbi:transposase [Nitrosomonas sp.]|uniref:transposase n=1 Tax=Nitrosomonas sp. TaxID=42353 RepID=UPI00374DD380